MRVEKNDLIILFSLEKKRKKPRKEKVFKVFFTPEMEFSCHKGLIKFNEILHYGELVFTNKKNQFLVVHPNSKDKMLNVDRSTTITYPKDLGMAIMELGIVSGSKILEIGTGSGASTFAFSNIIGEKGKIDTIDNNYEKQIKGKKNFVKYGKFQNVEWHIIKDLIHEKLDISVVDAIFLDIPEASYELISSISHLLKDGHPIGIVCPSFEQVKSVSLVLEKAGFIRIRCQELLERNYLLRKNSTRPNDIMHAHTAFYIFAEKMSKKSIEIISNLNNFSQQ